MTADRVQASEWCDRVWGGRRGNCHFAFGVGGYFGANGTYKFDHWHERPGRWPEDRDRFLDEAIERAAIDDVYVAPYLRSNANRKKGSALGSNIVFADLDKPGERAAGFERALVGPRGLLIHSGNGLHPYLYLPEDLEPEELERLNRHLAFSIGADAGWAENKVLRLPGTFNHKQRARGGDSTPVRLLEFHHAVKDWSPDELLELLGPSPACVGTNGATSIVPRLPETVPEHVLARLSEPPGGDRSQQSFAFVAACVDSGLEDATIVALALEHQPTREKYGARAATELGRLLGKMRKPSATPVSEHKGLTWQPLSEVDMRSIVFADKPLLQSDAFTLFVGRKGHGKGTAIAEIVSRVTRGELGDKRTVVWIASEDSAAIDILPRVIAAGGDPTRITIVKEGWVQLPRDIDAIRQKMEEIGEVGLLIIDPVGNHIRGKSSDSDTDIRDAIAPLNKLADDHACMVFGVRHLTEKECRNGVLAAILGSSAWVQVPRAVLAIARDNEDPSISHIQCVAGNRLPPGTPGRKFRIDGVLLPELENEVTVATWIGESGKDVEQMLAVTATKEPSSSEAARQLIRTILEDEGDQESDTLDARVANETNLSAKTVQNLRTELTAAGLIKNYAERHADGTVKHWNVRRTNAPWHTPEPTRSRDPDPPAEPTPQPDPGTHNASSHKPLETATSRPTSLETHISGSGLLHAPDPDPADTRAREHATTLTERDNTAPSVADLVDDHDAAREVEPFPQTCVMCDASFEFNRLTRCPACVTKAGAPVEEIEEIIGEAL